MTLDPSPSRTIKKPPAPPKKTNSFKKFMNTPKGYVLILLIGLSLVGTIGTKSFFGLRNELVGIVVALIIDTIIAIMQKRKKIFSDGGIITALIISMVLSDHASLIAVVTTTGIAVISKHVLKIKRKPIFNPAAVGLLVATYLFKSGQSWWGGLSLLPALSIILLLIFGYLILSRVNKFPQVFTYLGIYFLVFLAMGLLHIGSPGDPLRAPFINSAIFMAFFMLTDPPTSPGTLRNQMIYSAIASLVSVGIYIFFGGLTYLLIGLLCANVYNAVQSRFTVSKSAKKAQKNREANRRVTAH